MNYGLPYKGSKNRLAERIVRLLPRKKHLIDLFCGGCAVTHAALLKGKYEHIHINDLNWMCPTLFIDALAGKYDNETRWISRDDFFRLRDTDPYVAIVWSFGNNMRDYMYSREVEPLKRAIHYAIFFSDYAPGQTLGHDFSFVDGEPDVQKRYALIRRYFNGAMHSPLQAFEGGGRIRGCKTSRASSGSTPGFCTGGGDKARQRNFFFGGGGTGNRRAFGKRPSETQHMERYGRMHSLTPPAAKQLESSNRQQRINQIAAPRTPPRSGANRGGANPAAHKQCA